MERKVTIVGAGLIGGSICLAARRARTAETIVCIDQSAAPQDAERYCDRWLHSDDPAASKELSTSSLVFLCTPVRTVMAQVGPSLDATQCPVTDCGSTKLAIESCAQNHPEGGRFVPGHPMAGHPEGGLLHAQEDLFEDRHWILCPRHSQAQAVETVRQFVASLGAQVVELEADEHDRSVALTSHLPQVVASALSVMASERAAQAAAGPGFASATRIAGGAESMWRDIFETNARPVGEALQELGQNLQTLGERLQNSDSKAVMDILERARQLRGRAEPED